MALHWQHIKGVYGNTPLYTYIEFSNTNNAMVDALPSIYIGTTNKTARTDITGLTNLGKIVTSKATNQSIETAFSFLNTVTAHNSVNIIKPTTNNNNAWIFLYDDNNESPLKRFCIYHHLYDTTKHEAVMQIMQDGDRISIEHINKSHILDIDHNKISINRDTHLNNSQLICGNSDTVIDKNCIQAPYFNATSDRRAKENILPFSGKALDIINNLQTYTYNYKYTKQKSYGIMAQDMLNVDINGFSFVDNAAATGEGQDYMTIRESKLVYLLIEGIKEQQSEINKLRAELEELKHGK